MPDLVSAVNTAFAFAHEPSDLAMLVAPASECFRIPGTREVLDLAQNVETEEELNEILRRVAPTIGVPDPFKAAVMAMLAGTLIEWGADPAHIAGLLLARLPIFLRLAESVADRVETEDAAKVFAANPDGFRAWQSLSLMLLPTMAVLTRGMAYRQLARADTGLVQHINALRERNKEANFVALTLEYTDGLELIVLHPAAGKGFRVQLEAVHTNAHLFTLLQCELIGGGLLPGPAINDHVVGVARGEIPHEALVTDHARWHFYNWTGLLPDGSLAGAAVNSWLFVDDSPEAIPMFEGTRIVVLGPNLLGMRGWDSNFFANIHDALRSAARVVEELTAEQTLVWCGRIRAAG